MTHKFDGYCKPGTYGFVGQATFSLGVFEELPKANGKGTKRGPVKVRIIGPVSQAGDIEVLAKIIARHLDEGEEWHAKKLDVNSKHAQALLHRARLERSA